MFRQVKDLVRGRSVFDEVEQEEVVQVIGAQHVLRPLFDGPVVGGGQQFRADRGIADVHQGGGQFRLGFFRNVFDQAADERLGDGAVDRVHGHVVPVVCAPAQRDFRQVPGADDEAPRLVGQVHQDLRTLAGLDVFVSSGAFRRIVPDVAEVLQAGV